MNSFEGFLLALVPLLIAVDPAASVIVFLGLTEGVEDSRRRRVLRDAVITAMAIGVIFIFGGAKVFDLLGITTEDFEIGGGAILLVLSLADLVAGDKARRHRDEFVGIVPIGTPLIVGPAVLAALTVLTNTRGYTATTLAFLATIGIVAVSLIFSKYIGRAIGTGGLKAVSKIISIFLAGFAVHLIRLGVLNILAESKHLG